jgi:hypothetical protein
LNVIVYVEGDGDRLCLQTLLEPLIRTKQDGGVQIRFVPVTRGDRKATLLTNYPVRAANAIRNDPAVIVVILPDLYPANKGFDHRSCEQMQAGVFSAFRKAMERSGWDDRFADRFRVFCMIHDLEVLLLAAEEQLLDRCRLTEPDWMKPVEQQNQDHPPKRIVERLIANYDPCVDGPSILANADYRVISARCPHGFGKFVEFLESL